MSARRYNRQYRLEHINYANPEILKYCTEQTRCNVCRTHLKAVGWRCVFPGWRRLFMCPTCRKFYGTERVYSDKEAGA